VNWVYPLGEEFFVEAYDQEEHGPEHGELQQAHAVQGDCPKIEDVSCAQCQDQQRERTHPHRAPIQKSRPNALTGGRP
jgi:hypothetical protein